MGINPHALQAKAYLEELCGAMDRKEKLVRRREWWKTPLLVPAAMGLAMGLGCSGSVDKPAEDAEVCDNGTDDDDDGKIDCADSDCSDFAGCTSSALYAAPASEDCDNGKDDDGDGKVDCSDGDCGSYAGCISAEYAAPFENCTNQQDDDGDSKVDCDDADCYEDAACMPAPAYMAPIEFDCSNGADDDGDQKVDCVDEDCYDDPVCDTAMYAAP
jgi:hypothetical protein